MLITVVQVNVRTADDMMAPAGKPVEERTHSVTDMVDKWYKRVDGKRIYRALIDVKIGEYYLLCSFRDSDEQGAISGKDNCIEYLVMD